MDNGMRNLSVYRANGSQLNTSLSDTAVTATFVDFCWAVAVIYFVLLSSTLFLVVVMIKHYESLSGSRILIFHQIIMEAQITLLYWPVNYVLLPLLHPNYVTVTNKFCSHFFFGYVITLTATWSGLAVLALNRFIAVIRPFSYKHWITKPVIGVQILVPWIVGLATTVSFYISNGFFFSPKGKTCMVQIGTDFLVSSVFGVYLPLGVTCVLYIGLFMGITLKKFNRTVAVQLSSHGTNERSAHTRHGTNSGNRSSRRIGLAKGLFIISIIHLVGFASSPVLFAIVPDAPVRLPVLRQWITFLFYLGYLSTPVIIGYTNSDVRTIGRKMRQTVFRG